MIHLIKHLAHVWNLSPAHYWHLRMLCALLITPLIGVLYIVIFDRPKRPTVAKKLWH